MEPFGSGGPAWFRLGPRLRYRAMCPQRRCRHPAQRRALVPAACALVALAAAAGTGSTTAPPASAAIEIGVYQDNPPKTVPALRRSVGARGTRVISTYVTGGRLVEPQIVALAKRTGARLLVSWMPDGGNQVAGPRQPRFRLSAIRRGRQNRGLVRLTKQLRKLRPAPILRPMPEPNTPWYAWSGTVNKNTPGDYAKAWAKVRQVVRNSGGTRIKLLWAPYVRSIPDTPENAIAAYFPGDALVDLVGASGYNFGQVGLLAWTEPRALFEDVYRQVSALSAKPFWVAETASTNTGGSKAAWIAQLAGLRQEIPNLGGIVWYDARDPNGDFRVATAPARKAFKGLVKRTSK
jgi:Glycosyl hydrolase family 26